MIIKWLVIWNIAVFYVIVLFGKKAAIIIESTFD